MDPLGRQKAFSKLRYFIFLFRVDYPQMSYFLSLLVFSTEGLEI